MRSRFGVISLLLQLLHVINFANAGTLNRRTARSQPAPILPRATLKYGRSDGKREVVRPKVMILGMFSMEGDVWTKNMPELYNLNVTIPGLAPQFPTVHCTAPDGVCQMVTGVGEINAAASIFATTYSPFFDLRKTYFMIAGIAGGSPEHTTIGAVTLPRYAVQLDLQYELDSRDKPSNWSADASGYFPLGTKQPNTYPGGIYGTEAFELSAALRSRVSVAAKRAVFNDTDVAKAYRAQYVTQGYYGPNSDNYAAARRSPSIVLCDTATSNIYWGGARLAKAYEQYLKILTNGSAVYCSSQQEDNGSLTSLVRAASGGLVDFKRVTILRAISDFDRAPPGGGVSEYENLTGDQGGFLIAVENLYSVGREVVDEIVRGWKGVYERGVGVRNYVGDVVNSLRQEKPDIGQAQFYIS